MNVHDIAGGGVQSSGVVHHLRGVARLDERLSLLRELGAGRHVETIVQERLAPGSLHAAAAVVVVLGLPR